MVAKRTIWLSAFRRMKNNHKASTGGRSLGAKIRVNRQLQWRDQRSRLYWVNMLRGCNHPMKKPPHRPDVRVEASP